MTSDAVRRLLRASEVDNRHAVRALRTGLARAFESDDVPAPVRSAVVGLGRRDVLRLGGAGVVLATVASACSGGHHAGGTAPTTTSTTTAPDNAGDITILRTASSLEHYAVGIYMEAAGMNLLTTPAALDAARYFADHHSQHAGAFEGATAHIGGQPFTQANPVLSRRAAARLSGVRTEADVLRLAYEVETMAAATYVAAVGSVVEPALNATIMSVGAVEARHVTILGMLLDPLAAGGTPTPAYGDEAFASGSGGLATGTGV